MTPTIVKVNKLQLSQLQQLAIQTFKESFTDANHVDDLKEYITESFSMEKLSKELSNPNSVFYFAKINDQEIGYLKINVGDAQTELQENNFLEIERIYVLEKFIGKKVGQLLLEKAIKIALEKNMEYIWLGVWEENPRAINFYKKNGFVAFDKHIFTIGRDDQIDIMMKLKL